MPVTARLTTPNGLTLRTERYFASGPCGWRTAICDVIEPRIRSTPIPDPDFWRTRFVARVMNAEFPTLRARHRQRIVPRDYKGVFVNVYRGEGKPADHKLFVRVEKRLLELMQLPIAELEKLEAGTRNNQLP